MTALLKRDDVTQSGQSIKPFYDWDLLLEPVVNPAEAAAPLPAPNELIARHARLLNRISTELVQQQERLLDELRPHVLKLALELARAIMGREVASTSVIEHSLQQALQQLHLATRVTVRLHPDDLAYVQAQQTEPSEQVPVLTFIADPAIDRGGCYLQSDRGDIDARLATQLAHLGQALGVDVAS